MSVDRIEHQEARETWSEVKRELKLNAAPSLLCTLNPCIEVLDIFFQQSPKTGRPKK